MQTVRLWNVTVSMWPEIEKYLDSKDIDLRVLMNENDVDNTDDVLAHVALKSLTDASVCLKFKETNEIVTQDNFDDIWIKSEYFRSTPNRLKLITGPPKTFKVTIPDWFYEQSEEDSNE